MFYVYSLVDPRTNLPFYIGKGKGQRAFVHYKCVKAGKSSDNPCKDAIIRKLIDMGMEPTVSFLHVDLDEEQAFLLEEQYIKQYGRRDRDPNGILSNITLGGEGTCGRPSYDKHGSNNPNYGKKHPGLHGDNHPMKGKKGDLNPNFGSKRTEETRQIMSVHRKSKTYDQIFGDKAEEIKSKKSLSMKGKNTGPKSEETKRKISETKRRKALEKLNSDGP